MKQKVMKEIFKLPSDNAKFKQFQQIAKTSISITRKTKSRHFSRVQIVMPPISNLFRVILRGKNILFIPYCGVPKGGAYAQQIECISSIIG